MNLKSMNLVWIVVKDLKKAIQFYTDVIGLKLVEEHDQYGWAELEGHDGGARLGIAQMQLKNDDGIKPGQNAVATFTVESLDKAVGTLTKKGAQLVGSIEEVPGHVKMQMVRDVDGNHVQLVELIPSCGCAH